ncbi:hypothetical protein BDZ97DRAFT_1932511 [Flammula alnicola]|nr:hypothetical protein BDZ97DRAFT_1932511 [Flammula alnicola]
MAGCIDDDAAAAGASKTTPRRRGSNDLRHRRCINDASTTPRVQRPTTPQVHDQRQQVGSEGTERSKGGPSRGGPASALTSSPNSLYEETTNSCSSSPQIRTSSASDDVRICAWHLEHGLTPPASPIRCVAHPSALLPPLWRRRACKSFTLARAATPPHPRPRHPSSPPPASSAATSSTNAFRAGSYNPHTASTTTINGPPCP